MTKQLRYLCTLLLCMIASVGWAEDLTEITLTNTTISFSAPFNNAGFYKESVESFSMQGSNNQSYAWYKFNCMKGSTNGTLQMKAASGYAISPTIKKPKGIFRKHNLQCYRKRPPSASNW